MNATTLTLSPTAQPVAEPVRGPFTTRGQNRKISFGAAAILLAVTAAGLALGLGGGIADVPAGHAPVPTAGAATADHVTPDHIVHPR